MFDAKVDIARNHSMNFSSAVHRDVGQTGKYEGKDGGAGPYIALRKPKKQKEEKKERPVAQGHINIVA